MSESIRILANPRKACQRLGLLKPLIALASRSTTNSVDTLGSSLRNALSKKMDVPVDRGVQEYVRRVLTPKRYKDLREVVAKDEPGKVASMEVQDYLLSDPILPSRRGKLSEDDWKRYVVFAKELDLLREGTYSVTSRGKAFQSTVEEGAMQGFDAPKRDLNPLLLTTLQKALLLYALIDSDGDVIRELMLKLGKLGRSFTDEVAGDLLPDVFREIAKRSGHQLLSGDEKARLQKILDTAALIERMAGRPSPGGKNPREHNVVTRLEPLVDIGLLVKDDPITYEYRLPDQSSNFFEQLSSTTVGDFLESKLFSSLAEASGVERVSDFNDGSLSPALKQSYEAIKSPMGFASLGDLAILVCGRLLQLDKPISMEINSLKEWIKKKQKQDPSLIQFSVDRMGRLAFVRFSTSFFSRTS